MQNLGMPSWQGERPSTEVNDDLGLNTPELLLFRLVTDWCVLIHPNDQFGKLS